MTTYYVAHNETNELIYLSEEEPPNDEYNGQGHQVFETDLSIEDINNNYEWSIYTASFQLKESQSG